MKVAKDRNADVKVSEHVGGSFSAGVARGLTAGACLQLVDFGFAKHFDRKYDPMDTQLGTQDFMAPEVPCVPGVARSGACVQPADAVT